MSNIFIISLWVSLFTSFITAVLSFVFSSITLSPIISISSYIKSIKWNGTCTCAKLRGTDGKTDRLRSCRGCVADCARITEDFLFKGEFEPYEERRADEE
ncbi:hypothetical protein [Candidatus Proelusimicrobium excrementi]|uniref:hypothetical protein n=1 Tax=Candidatus Proelusimicrobium excrementi TaxID=3416222 RepID=UPI003D149607